MGTPVDLLLFATLCLWLFAVSTIGVDVEKPAGFAWLFIGAICIITMFCTAIGAIVWSLLKTGHRPF